MPAVLLPQSGFARVVLTSPDSFALSNDGERGKVIVTVANDEQYVEDLLQRAALSEWYPAQVRTV